ncbi:hypothetical protein CDAR_396911 [Caerostris darwini]|uniref:Uncharacterized protein n=1 Tax=Caerostris darwini TaxID=1538125 RepID=A0AAV4Q5R4_9ARAC|nr:hypothetical protein CDAR_396911 [Caerostris darwini]
MATGNQRIVEDTGPFEIAPCSRQMFSWKRAIHSKRNEMTLEVFLEERNLKTADPLSSANTESILAWGGGEICLTPDVSFELLIDCRDNVAMPISDQDAFS